MYCLSKMLKLKVLAVLVVALLVPLKVLAKTNAKTSTKVSANAKTSTKKVSASAKTSTKKVSASTKVSTSTKIRRRASTTDYQPYIGVDIQRRYTPFKQFFGSDIFRKDSFQGNFYFGFKLNPYLGFELAHQVSDKKDRNVFVSDGAIHLGEPSSGNFREIGSKKIKGWNLNLMGFIPVLDSQCRCRLNIIGILGVSNLEATLKDLRVDSTNSVFNQIVFNKRKTVPRIGAGLQKMITDQVGIRTTFIWENTERFNNIASKGFEADSIYTIKLKNSIVYSLGLFAAF